MQGRLDAPGSHFLVLLQDAAERGAAAWPAPPAEQVSPTSLRVETGSASDGAGAGPAGSGDVAMKGTLGQPPDPAWAGHSAFAAAGSGSFSSE